jgi:hypothetical protein
MDQVLKGKDTGLDQLYGFESQGTDRSFRRSAAWPPVAAATLDLGGLPVSCNATCSTQEVALMAADAEALRMAGSPVVTVDWQAQTEDPVLTAVLYIENSTGRHWVGEATMRGMYRDSLEEPSPVVVGETYRTTFALYPLDAILRPGESWVLVFGASTEQGTGTAAGILGAVPAYPGDAFYDVSSATFAASIQPAVDGLLPTQPVEGECFTC